MTTKILDGKVILAIHIPAEYKAKGIEFFTPDHFSQQLAYMNRPKNYQIQPHVHNDIKREIFKTTEVLFIKSGIVKVDFYNKKKEYLESLIVKAGDILLLAEGGHGFQMLEDSEIIEVKQGPYVGEKDKERFDIPKIEK